MRKRVGFDDPVPGTHVGRPTIVNRHGEPIQLTTQQKNALYRQAKRIKETLPDCLCTRRETHQSKGRAVQKMLHSEFRAHPKMEYMKKCMTAIGADPRECNPNNYRRR